MKLSDFDDFGFPSHVGVRKSVRIVDNAENIGLDILFDDVNFLSLIGEGL